MRNKNILIINDYAGSPHYGMEFRHYYLSKELIKLGNSVTIISSSYSHLFKHLPLTNHEIIDGINYCWIKTINYGDAHNKKRVIKWFMFSFKLLKYMISNHTKPDVIIVSTAAPFAILPSYWLAKKNNSKLIFEVKDIWPMSLVSLGNFKPSHPFIKFMSWFEKFALERSDIIVSNLQNYDEHIKNNVGIDRSFEWISNGIDLDELERIEPLSNEIAKQLPKDKFIIGYTGTIGVANALDSFLESAKVLKNNSTDILFVIVGDGKEKKKLFDTYSNLDNVLFIDSIPKQQIQSMLSLFDLCFIGWKSKKIYNYGISANKIFDYMYSAKPILHAYSGKRNIVKISNCGLTVEAENPQAIADGILKLYNMDKETREQLGQNGKQYVLKHFTYEKLAEKYNELF